MGQTDFLKQFVIPETRSIAGRWLQNFITLAVIFFLALLAIGIGRGAINYLRVKMDDPFIKFVIVTNDFSIAEYLDIDKLEDSAQKNKFMYEEVALIYNNFENFKGVNNQVVNAMTRKISTDEDLYKFVNNPENGIIQTENNAFSDNSWGVIVTRGFLSELGYKDSDPPYINYVYSMEGKETVVPIPVSAVVSELPDINNMLISSKLYAALRGDSQLDITSGEHQKYLRVFIPNLDGKPSGLDTLKLITKTETFIQGITLDLYSTNVDFSHEYNRIKASYPEAMRIYDLDKVSPENTNDQLVDKISFSFSSLDSITAFQEYLLNEHQLEVDMSTIKDKENFNFFNKLTKLLSFTLISFSIGTIVMFVTNLILTHLERNKKNLGTLKAFGLTNHYIVIIYTGISIALIAVAFFSGYVLSLYSGDLLVERILHIFKIGTDTKSLRFESYPILTLLLLFLVLPTAMIYLRLLSNLNKKTPGDLIYERD